MVVLLPRSDRNARQPARVPPRPVVCSGWLSTLHPLSTLASDPAPLQEKLLLVASRHTGAASIIPPSRSAHGVPMAIKTKNTGVHPALALPADFETPASQ